jgi:beta-phosphoglucomutase
VRSAATQPRRAVLFDMDGVLVDSTAPHVAAWKRFLDEQGLPPPAEGVRSLFGRRALDAVAGLLGIEATEPEAQAAVARLEEYAGVALAGHGPGGLLVDGVTPLVRDLAAAGWRLAVATSARRQVATHSLGPLLDAFEALVAAEDVERGKPAPEVYLTAAGRLDVKPSGCVVVEDAVAGVEAGRAAGMYVVAVSSTAPQDRLRQAGAHTVVPHVTDLPVALERRARRAESRRPTTSGG